MVGVGEVAPIFSAKLTNGSEIKDFGFHEAVGKDNIVLAFLFGAFTPVCTNEMCSFRDSLGEFQKLRAKVYGVTVDTPYTLNAFIKANNLNIEMISDFNREAVRKYHVMYEDFRGLKGISKRAVFIIDKEGKIRYRWVTEDPKNPPSMDEIKRELKKLH